MVIRVVILSSILHLLMWHHAYSTSSNNYTFVNIGVVLDSNSSIGSMIEVCISMAISDFYSRHSGYKTRLFLHTQYPQNQLEVISQVLEMLQKEEVHGILGFQRLTEGSLIGELAERVQVPVISLTSRSQSVSNPQNQYFVRTTPDNSNQLKALAAIYKRFNWSEIGVMYEATESGRDFFLELTNNAFQLFDIMLSSMISISPLASDDDIKKGLKMMQNRVVLVHMDPELGGRLFLLAKTIGMMEKGYAWIVTDSIGNFVNSMDSTVIEAMKGVIGIRAFIPISKNLKSFKERLGEEMIHSKIETSPRELNVYGLLAYDTVWALAMAAEMVGPMKSSFSRTENGGNGSYLSSLATSDFGPKLLHQLFNVSFEGLSGEFKLIDGKLKLSSLEIFNVIGTGSRKIGYWTPDGVLSVKPFSKSKEYSTSIHELRSIVWPGDSFVTPKGWAIPSGKLKVGVPLKTVFTEFVTATVDPLTKWTNATGFCIDLFNLTIKLLPFHLDFEFAAFDLQNGSSYTDLIHNLSTKYDIIVGDTTILADRAVFMDFTMPYSESGTVLVVKNKGKDMWVFFKPFKLSLWMTFLATCIFIGIVLRILEHPAIINADNVNPHKEHHSLLFWFPMAVLAFPEGNMVKTNWSRFVLVVYLYMTYLVMQSYTAKLSSMFTLDQLNLKLSKDMYIGYQEGSFVRDYMVNRLQINESKLRKFSSIDELRHGMNIGGNNGGYDAIMDEIPYMKILLKRYGSEYKTVGPIYKTDGLGFAFPFNSPLVTHFSRAILEITESPNMSAIVEKNFGLKYSLDNQIDYINKDNPSLTAYDFGGIFIIFGSVMLFVLFCSWTSASFLGFLSTGGGNDFRTNSSVVHPDLDGVSDHDDHGNDDDDDDDDDDEQEVEIIEEINVNGSVINGSARVSGQIDVDESNESEIIEEIQQTQPNQEASR